MTLTDDYTLKPYRVRVVDTEGPAWWIELRALGRNDARNLAREEAYEQGADDPAVIEIVEVADAA